MIYILAITTQCLVLKCKRKRSPKRLRMYLIWLNIGENILGPTLRFDIATERFHFLFQLSAPQQHYDNLAIAILNEDIQYMDKD